MSQQPLTLPLVTWSAMRLNLYWAYEGKPFYARSTGTVSSQTAWLLRRGSVHLQWRDQPLTVSAGQWVILGAGRGDHEFSDDAQLVSICFRAEWFTGQAFFDDSFPIVLEAAACPRVGQKADRLVRLARRVSPREVTRLPQQSNTFPAYLRLHRTYLEWLEAVADQLARIGVALRGVNPTDERVLHGIRLVEDWPMERPFDERVVAEAVGVSRVHFSRLFAVELGLSAKAYFERRRLKAARERLAADTTPIKTIAYQLGFHDAAHFSNWFHKQTGVSPSHFRKGWARPWSMA